MVHRMVVFCYENLVEFNLFSEVIDVREYGVGLLDGDGSSSFTEIVLWIDDDECEILAAHSGKFYIIDEV